ncbi:MAG: hypothetical protein KGH59_00805 [Candidatus Micrarchaeota archaeon]|nr:hypothetical protein [Candidatus Micrarchaeota archaeon]
MKYHQLISALALSLLVCFLIVVINGITSLFLETDILLICAFLLLFLLRAMGLLADLYQKAILKGQVLQFLSSIIYYKYRNATSKEMVERSFGASSPPNLIRIKNRIRLGDTLLNAINAEFIEVIGGENTISTSGDLYDKVSRFVVSSLQKRKARLSTASDSIQRYSTISMFLSAILPSFLIFGYIGSTVISQTSISLIGLSIGLLIVLPFVYATSVTALSRRLIENVV